MAADSKRFGQAQRVAAVVEQFEWLEQVRIFASIHGILLLKSSLLF